MGVALLLSSWKNYKKVSIKAEPFRSRMLQAKFCYSHVISITHKLFLKEHRGFIDLVLISIIIPID